MKYRWEIPPSWHWVKMVQIADIIGGGTPSTTDDSNFDPDGIPWITPADLTGYKEVYILKGRRGLSQKGYYASSAKLLPTGSVLFSSRAPIGYCVISAKELCTSQGFKTFVLKGGISSEYTRYYLKSSVEYAESLASGTTFKELSGARAGEMYFPLAPLPEQKRIAFKIDSLSAKSQIARYHFEEISSLIEKYKISVLEKAFNQDLASGNKLQSRWASTSVGDLVVRIKSGKNLRCEERPPNSNERGVVKVSAVTWGNFNPKASKTLPPDYIPDEDSRVRSGDLLFSRANTLQLVGAVVIVESTPGNLYLSDKILRLEMDDEDKSWLLWYLRSPKGRMEIEARASGNQESMRNISQRELRSIDIPWPIPKVRRNIINHIERCFKAIDNIKSYVSKSNLDLVNLDKAILQKAFQGKLFSQDPKDESALSLLAVIESSNEPRTRISKKQHSIKANKFMKKKSLFDVLSDAGDWLEAQEAFRRCGISQNATTEEIEPIYAQLRSLDESGALKVETVRDEEGRKRYDNIKLINLESHAP